VRAREERFLSRAPGIEPGVDEWHASLPTERAATAWSVVDSVARRYVREGLTRTLDQARADALVDLIESRATGTVEVQLLVPVGEAAQHASPVDSADDLVPVDGAATLSRVSRSWLEDLVQQVSPRTSRSGRATGAGTTSAEAAEAAEPTSGSGITARTAVVLCDDSTGAVTSVPIGLAATVRARRPQLDSDSHDPPAALAALVRARDRRCRFPGCAVSARFCDLDHVITHPLGDTSAGNLICLCRRHHRVKQRLRWSVVLETDGTVTWTDPTGRRRSTQPDRMLPLVTAGTRTSDTTTARDAGSPVTARGDVPSALEEQLDHHCRRMSRLPSHRQRADALQRDVASLPVVDTHHRPGRRPVLAPPGHHGRRPRRSPVDPPF
jgi:hypothetical protein